LSELQLISTSRNHTTRWVGTSSWVYAMKGQCAHSRIARLEIVHRRINFIYPNYQYYQIHFHRTSRGRPTLDGIQVLHLPYDICFKPPIPCTRQTPVPGAACFHGRFLGCSRRARDSSASSSRHCDGPWRMHEYEYDIRASRSCSQWWESRSYTQHQPGWPSLPRHRPTLTKRGRGGT
jgi:hypothetical protein